MTIPLVSRVVFSPASRDAQADGLLGHVEFDLLSVLRINAAVRRTRAGEIALSFPVRHDKRGVQHAILRPVDQNARERLTQAIAEAIGLNGTANTLADMQGDSP